MITKEFNFWHWKYFPVRSTGLIPKRYDVKEWAMHFSYCVNQKFQDCNAIDTSPYTYHNDITRSIEIVDPLSRWGVRLLQPSTAILAKTVADIAKKSLTTTRLISWDDEYFDFNRSFLPCNLSAKPLPSFTTILLVLVYMS